MYQDLNRVQIISLDLISQIMKYQNADMLKFKLFTKIKKKKVWGTMTI